MSLSDEDGFKHVLMDSVLKLWEGVNDLTRLRPSRRERYRVTIFGSARSKPGPLAYVATMQAAASLAKMGCDIITEVPDWQLHIASRRQDGAHG